MAFHFVLQYWDFGPEKVGRAVLGGDLDSPTTYHIFANGRIGQVSLRAHNDKKTKAGQWPAILISYC